MPIESTLLGYMNRVRKQVEFGIIHSAQRRDNRDMTADGHAKGSTNRVYS